MPDRLPSLILLAGFWVPPMVAGWVAAGSSRRRTKGAQPRTRYAGLAAFALGYAALWFVFNLNAMPPYVPGATKDPTFAPPGAVGWLALITIAVILPGSILACVLAFRRRARTLRS